MLDIGDDRWPYALRSAEQGENRRPRLDLGYIRLFLLERVDRRQAKVRKQAVIDRAGAAARSSRARCMVIVE